MKRFIFLIILSTFSLYALPAKVEQFIHSSTIPKRDISIYIEELSTKDTIISLNPNTSRVPASVMKLFSIYTVIRELGFDYQIPTDIYIKGKIASGVVDGDLIIKAYGDPTLNSKFISKVVSILKSKGVTKIRGNIVIDRSYFKVSNKNNSGFDEHRYSAYNAMPDAMMFNQRVSVICVAPKSNRVYTKIPDKSIVLHNNLQVVNKSCKGRYSWPFMKIDDSSSPTQVWLSGKISKRCSQRNISQVLTKPYQSLFYALKDRLNRAGIECKSKLILARVPKGAKFFYRYKSAKLEKIVAITAKKSNNLFARHLMLIAGAKMYGAPATLEKGRKAIKKILKKDGISLSNGFFIDNGCGLSRKSRVSAKMLNDLLHKAYRRYSTRWLNALSIAGVDGTIKRRFRGSIAQKRAWMKTGTLKRVKNIAGYVKAKDGRLYSVVILVNTKRGNFRASKLQNDIIKWLVTYKKNRTNIVDEYNKLDDSDSSGMSLYYIQVGVFSQNVSKGYLSHIKDLGYKYKIEDKENAHKVLIGPFSSSVDAKIELSRVKDELNSNAFIVEE